MAKKKSKQKDIAKKVMKKIKKDEVRMRPKSYFVAGSVLLALGLFATVVSSALFAHSAMFNIRTLAPFAYFRLGAPGIRPFLFAFPWLPVLISGSLIYLGVYFLKKYDIAYKKNLGLLIVGIIAAVLIGMGLFAKFRVERAAKNVKGLRNFYREKEEFMIPTPRSRGVPKRLFLR